MHLQNKVFPVTVIRRFWPPQFWWSLQIGNFSNLLWPRFHLPLIYNLDFGDFSLWGSDFLKHKKSPKLTDYCLCQKMLCITHCLIVSFWNYCSVSNFRSSVESSVMYYVLKKLFGCNKYRILAYISDSTWLTRLP